MTLESALQFHIYFYLLWVYAHLAYCLNRVLNVKELVGAFNVQPGKGPIVEAFSVIVTSSRTFVCSSSAEQ